MDTPPPPSAVSRPCPRPLASLPGSAISGLLALLVTTLVATLLATLPAARAAAQEGRPDQVYLEDERSGGMTTVSGVLEKNDLDGIAFEEDAEEVIASARVQRIVFGDVPTTFREARLLEERGDHLNAAATYKLAAADEDARDVVRAAARLRAAEMLLLHGGEDPTAYADADTAATRFLEESPNNREVPRARFGQATARLLAGDAPAAAELFRALYREGSGNVPTKGYDRVLCLRAGLRGAHAFLMSEETLPAREIFSGIEASLPGVIAALAEDDETRQDLLDIQAAARLGEGFVLLAAGSTGQARSFFEKYATQADAMAAERFGVALGMGLVKLAEGNAREAQFDLATVSSLDHTDRDRVARALVGLAEAGLQLSDDGATARASAWLASVTDQFPDSIWARKAQELADQL